MNPKPKGVPGSHFVGLDIFRRTLTVVDEKKDDFQGGYAIKFEIKNNIILVDNRSGHYRPTKNDVIDAKIFFEENQLTGDIFVTFIPFK